MKPFFITALIFTLLLSACSNYKVYSVRDNPKMPVQGGVVYALPHTQLRVVVTVERRDMSTAPYAPFAVDMLGATEADIDTNYRIVGIDVTPFNVADPDNYFFVKVRRGSVVVDERHLLLAVGDEGDGRREASGIDEGWEANGVESGSLGNVRNGRNDGAAHTYNLYDRADTFYTRYDAPGHPSLITTKKDVRTLRQRAEEAAGKIDELQTRRQELLMGETDGVPDGATLRFLLEQLSRQEQALKALFLGTPCRETVYFFVDPVLRKTAEFVDTVAWFSSADGFLNEDEVSRNQVDEQTNDLLFPIVCSVQSLRTMQSTSRFVRYHTSGTTPASGKGSSEATRRTRGRKTFRYRIPEQASVTVFTPQYSFSRTLPISQFGPIVELPRQRIKASFDPETLDLRRLIIDNR